MNIILLSGGSGMRLWPLSNNVRSKQFIKILRSPSGAHESMVQRMYRMIKDTDQTSSVTIAISENQVASIRSQLDVSVGISVEPCRRDTFPAIALATAYLHDEMGIDDGESVVVCPVDPYVEASYFKMLASLQEQVENGSDSLVLMGIEPTYPSAKYGYIIPSTKDAVSSVDSFKEKPDEATAGKYIAKGALWNAGVFAYKLSYVLDKSRELLGTSDYKTLFDVYETLPKISFDYAVVEKEEKISVLRYKGTWKDLGTWNTLTEAMSDEVAGNAVAAECENVHIINELQLPLVALGVKDVVIAATPDGILVSDKEMSSYLKDYVVDARPMTEKRLWGEYEVLDYRAGVQEGNASLTKHLYIKAGEHISYQIHHHRSETWVIAEGIGKVILDDKIRTISRGDTVIVPVGSKHAVKADTDLHIIEVQVGDELTEEDIEHLDWDWTARDRYDHWISAGLEIEGESLTEGEISDAFGLELRFGTGGLRAVMGTGTNRLNVYTVAKATAGVSKYINAHYDNPSVVIAYDTRHNSKKFADVAAKVFTANGIKVYVFSEPTPTPMLSYAVWNLDCSAGVVITASHNSKEYNGYKVYDENGCQITDKAAREIQECIDSVDIYGFSSSLKECEIDAESVPESIFDDYIDSTVAESFVKERDSKNLRILYTPLNGTGLKPVMAAIGGVGFENVINIPDQRESDGDFPTCPSPNPELESVMEYCIPFAEQYDADIIIATDPDCDRIGVVCKGFEGDYKRLTPNEVGVLLLDWICRKYEADGMMPEKPVFMRTVVTTSLADKIAEKYGVKVINTLTGFKYIGEQIEEPGNDETFIFAMEESCGYLSNSQIRDKDGVNATLLVCMMAQECKDKGSALDDRLKQLYYKYGWYVNNQMSIEFEGSDGAKQMKAVMGKLDKSLPRVSDADIVEVIDYSKGYEGLPPTNMREFQLSDGSRFLIRPSGTEPKLKIYIEAVGNGEQDANNRAENIKRYIGEVI